MQRGRRKASEVFLCNQGDCRRVGDEAVGPLKEAQLLGMGSCPLLNYRLPRISTSLLPLLGLKVLRQKTKALARLRVK